MFCTLWSRHMITTRPADGATMRRTSTSVRRPPPDQAGSGRGTPCPAAPRFARAQIERTKGGREGLLPGGHGLLPGRSTATRPDGGRGTGQSAGETLRTGPRHRPGRSATDARLPAVVSRHGFCGRFQVSAWPGWGRVIEGTLNAECWAAYAARFLRVSMRHILSRLSRPSKGRFPPPNRPESPA